MKSEIKVAILSVLGTDNTIPKDHVSYVMDVLDGKRPVPSADTPTLERVIHRKEARALLGLCDRSLDLLANQGKLVRVMGIGRRSIGFTASSVRDLVAARASTAA